MKIDGNITGVYDVLKKQKGQLNNKDEVQRKPAEKTGLFKKVLSDKSSQTQKTGAAGPSRRQPAGSLDRSRHGFDHVNISQKSQVASAIMDRVLKTPAARAEKIKEIKRQIEAGTYKIDSKTIAEKMIRDGVLEDLLRPI